MPLVTCDCCSGSGPSCCCVPPHLIKANTKPDGTGTFDVVFQYQSTWFAAFCGTTVAFHTYKLISSTYPDLSTIAPWLYGALSNIYSPDAFIALGYWCGYPDNEPRPGRCMSDPYTPGSNAPPWGIPVANFPAPPNSRVMLYNTKVQSLSDIQNTSPLDLASASCSCGVLVDPDGVLWQFPDTIDYADTDANYKASCPDLSYYQMTPCSGSGGGSPFVAYSPTAGLSGTVWFDGTTCFTALATVSTTGAKPLCSLIEETDCLASDCTGGSGPFIYQINKCHPLDNGPYYFSWPSFIASGTIALVNFSSTPPPGSASLCGTITPYGGLPNSTATSMTTYAHCFEC